MKRRRRRKSAIMVPVASMGDIAFLLIIFFVLCSHFVDESGKQLEPPLAMTLEELAEFRHKVMVEADGTIWLNKQEVGSADTLESVLSQELEDVPEGERDVLLKMDYNLAQDEWMPVVDAIAEAGGKLLVYGEEGDPQARPAESGQ
jgi:biopolymer transport protein ExbD